jgi:hypothetical protein
VIRHQINQLRILEKHQPQLHSGFTTVQLELQLSINAYDLYSTYSPDFYIDEIFHMLYYIPSIGIFTPTANDTIQLQYLTNHPASTFSSSTLQDYITNNPIICLISTTTTEIDIYHISDTFLRQDLFTNPPVQSPSTTINTKKRIKQESPDPTEQPPVKKIYKTTLQSRLAKSKWRIKNKILLQQQKQQNNKKGIIQILNEHPDTNIDQLVQQTTIANTRASLPLTLLPSTTKSWTEVLNYDPSSHEKPKHTTYKKRSEEHTSELHHPM